MGNIRPNCRFAGPAVWLAVIPAAIAIPASAFAQQTVDAGQSTQLDTRIAELESRVERLEGLLFSTVQLSVYDAQRSLEAAQRQLEQNKRLYFRGHLAAIEIDRSRYDVDRARLELELARATSGHRRISANIDIMEAEFQLKQAKERLRFDENVASRGFVSEHQLQRNRQQVDRATKALQLARDKLAALGEPDDSSGTDDTSPKR